MQITSEVDFNFECTIEDIIQLPRDGVCIVFGIIPSRESSLSFRSLVILLRDICDSSLLFRFLIRSANISVSFRFRVHVRGTYVSSPASFLLGILVRSTSSLFTMSLNSFQVHIPARTTLGLLVLKDVFQPPRRFDSALYHSFMRGKLMHSHSMHTGFDFRVFHHLETRGFAQSSLGFRPIAGIVLDLALIQRLVACRGI